MGLLSLSWKRRNTRFVGGAIGAGVPSPSQAKRANELRSGNSPNTMSAAPTHRKGSMPKNGGPMRQPVSHQGTKPKIVPGATMKNTSDPSAAQKRRMVHPPMNARHGSARTGYTLSRHWAPTH